MKRHEPVLKKKSASYSILFLRDDSKVVRFRINPAWVKLLVVIFVAFSGASGAAGYGAHYYWKRYTALKLEYSRLEARLGENSRKLAAYSGVELIKEASALPRSTMAGVSSLAVPGDEGKGNAASGQPETQNGSSGGETNTVAGPATSAGQTQGPPAEAPAASAGTVSGNGTGDGTAQPADAAPVQAGGAGAMSDEHPALVSDVQIRSAGNKSFKLAFDLSNRAQQLTLNGRVQIAIATRNGERHEVTQVNRDSLRFIINKYKRVNTSFVLPADIQPEDVGSLFLTVTAEDQPSVTYSFPMPASS